MVREVQVEENEIWILLLDFEENVGGVYILMKLKLKFGRMYRVEEGREEKRKESETENELRKFSQLLNQ
jgi:hypothetical protein